MFYYSPYERTLPCAVYIPELNALVASSYNDYSASKLTTRYYDIGRIIGSSCVPMEEIVGYTMNQSSSYMGKSLELLGVADLLLKEYIKNGEELLKMSRLGGYVRRKISGMLESRENKGRESRKSVSSISCSGYRFAELPEDIRIIRIYDRFIAASRFFVRSASAAANKLGYDTIISPAVDSEHAPLHLMIPDAGLFFVTENDILSSGFESKEKISLERFYSKELLCSREHYVSFFGDYIRKMYNESALYARICMDIKNQGRKLLMPYISEKAAEEIAAEIVYGILNK